MVPAVADTIGGPATRCGGLLHPDVLITRALRSPVDAVLLAAQNRVLGVISANRVLRDHSSRWLRRREVATRVLPRRFAVHALGELGVRIGAEGGAHLRDEGFLRGAQSALSERAVQFAGPDEELPGMEREEFGHHRAPRHARWRVPH